MFNRGSIILVAAFDMDKLSIRNKLHGSQGHYVDVARFPEALVQELGEELAEKAGWADGPHNKTSFIFEDDGPKFHAICFYDHEATYCSWDKRESLPLNIEKGRQRALRAMRAYQHPNSESNSDLWLTVKFPNGNFGYGWASWEQLYSDDMDVELLVCEEADGEMIPRELRLNGESFGHWFFVSAE